jgi:hypothetical protein
MVGAIAVLAADFSDPGLPLFLVLIPALASSFITYKYIPPRKVGKVVNTILGLFVLGVSFLLFVGHPPAPLQGLLSGFGAILWTVSSYPNFLQKLTEQREPDE